MKRRLLLKALDASSFGSRLARGASAMRRIGILADGNPGPTDITETDQVLEPFGWIDGKNIVLIMRYDQHDAARREELAAELVRLSPDVLVTQGHAKTQALQRATSTIPIFAVVDDAIAEGFSKSLATPSGNITGLSSSLGDIEGKQIQLLLQVVPRLERLGYFHHARYVTTTESISGFVTAARAANIAVELVPVRDMGDLSIGRSWQRTPGIPAYRRFARIRSSSRRAASCATTSPSRIASGRPGGYSTSSFGE